MMRACCRAARGETVSAPSPNTEAAIGGTRRKWTPRITSLWLLVPALGFLAVFFAYPLASIVLRSFDGGASGLTLEHYSTFFTVPVYPRILWQTIEISLLTTILCVLVGYPLAYVMANSSPAVRNVMLLMVMLPFMTSVLVRTYGWMVILRPTGLLNHVAQLFGLPAVELLYNRPGMLIGLVYTMTPYVVLTLYSVMRGIDGRLVAVARSLGASGWSAFWRIYFPLSLPGVAGASLLVFILSSGFYITPRLMGGDRDQLLASIIAYQVDVLLNFEFASAIAVILLAITLVCFGIYARAVGLKQLLTSRT